MQHSSIEEQMETNLVSKGMYRFNHGFSQRDIGGLDEEVFHEALKEANKKSREKEVSREVAIVKKATQFIETVMDFVSKHPNDQELGAAVREYINNLK